MEDNQELAQATMSAREALHAVTDAFTETCYSVIAGLQKLARDGDKS